MLAKPRGPDVPLTIVLESYFLARTDYLPSKKHARLAGRTLLACWGEAIRAGQITEAKQKEFAEWSIKKGHSLSYISRNLSVLAAAVARSDIAIKVRFGKREIGERWNLRAKAPRRRFVPSDAEIGAFLLLDMPQDLFRWCVMAALTGARPEAVLDLTPAQRVREAGLIELNPPGRPQNKKYRPTVKEPKALTGWLDRWEAEMQTAMIDQGRFCAYSSVDSLQTAMSRARDRAKLPLLSVYSFRHKAVTVLRQARVPEDEIAMQIGHKRPGLEVTAGYGEWSPDYLARSAAALDAWWAKLAKGITHLNSRVTPNLKLVKKLSA